MTTLSEMIRTTWPRNRARRAAEAAGVSIRTAQKWVWGDKCPSAEVLLRMAARCPEFRTEFKRRLEEAAEAARNKRAAPQR